MWFLNIRNLLIFSIVMLVAASTVVAVTAYSSATVTSPAVIKIVSTDQALLALSPGIEYTNDMVVQNGGVLKFNFSFDPAAQQDYEFEKLFTVTNNSAETVGIKVESEGIDYITSIEPHNPTLNPEDHTYVKVEFHIDEETEEGTEPGILRVKAEAQ